MSPWLRSLEYVCDFCGGEGTAKRIHYLFSFVFKKDLKDALKGDLSGNLEHVMVALVTPPAVFDAKQLKKSLKVGQQRWTLLHQLFIH